MSAMIIIIIIIIITTTTIIINSNNNNNNNKTSSLQPTSSKNQTSMAHKIQQISLPTAMHALGRLVNPRALRSQLSVRMPDAFV